MIRFGLLVTLFVPVLKFVVQMVGGQLPGKLKMSLKNVFIDLNDGLWFIGSVIRTFLVSPGTLQDSVIEMHACSAIYQWVNSLSMVVLLSQVPS